MQIKPITITISEQEFKKRNDNGEELCNKCFNWLVRDDDDIGCDRCGAAEDDILSLGWAMECGALVLRRHMPQEELTDKQRLEELQQTLISKALAEEKE